MFSLTEHSLHPLFPQRRPDGDVVLDVSCQTVDLVLTTARLRPGRHGRASPSTSGDRRIVPTPRRRRTPQRRSSPGPGPRRNRRQASRWAGDGVPLGRVPLLPALRRHPEVDQHVHAACSSRSSSTWSSASSAGGRSTSAAARGRSDPGSDSCGSSRPSPRDASGPCRPLDLGDDRRELFLGLRAGGP